MGILLLTLPALGQKNTKSKKSTVRKTIMTIDRSTQFPIFDVFGLLVSIDNAGMARAELLSSEKSNTWNPVNLKMAVDHISRSVASRNSKSPYPMIVIDADPTLKYGAVAKFLEGLRGSGRNRLKIAFGTQAALVVPAKQPPTPYVKPNPLFLSVSIAANGDIDLNGEANGSIADTASLTDRLREIFQARAENGVFRELTNEIETTVSIRSSEMRTMSDLEKVFNAIKAAGSDRIVLGLSQDPPVFILQTTVLVN